ncbi:MAG: exo-alpha-sialidase, partial [Alistipes sp.]|nr:exo-alpha-sialidase [Alistipes sp.]
CLARITMKDAASYELSISVDDFITFPGGNKKFTIRYDEQSKRYWTITNPASERGPAHSGIYANGLSYGLSRNKMVLCYSPDLKQWIQYKTIVYNEDRWFHGFQYVDWQFDGEDIIAVSRTAVPEERGLPVRQHDANMMTFHRIKNFRTL